MMVVVGAPGYRVAQVMDEVPWMVEIAGKVPDPASMEVVVSV